MSESSASTKACPKCGAALPSAATAGLCPRCLLAEAMAPTQSGAESLPPPPTLSPAALAPHFPQLEILECLGRGGMGVVYRARQKSLNRFVALKLLAPERVADPSFAERFAREAQALAALNHPNIVTIHDFGQAGGFYFLLMEFVDGVNLRQAMKAGRFTPEQALAIVPPVCEALQYAHEHGIVHRDIKPENLLLDKDGRVKIADFGIAKLLGSERAPLAPGATSAPASHPSGAGETIAASTAGTPQYMAPEQRDHRRTDHRADIYSLGVVLYELLTGELPGAKLQAPSRKVQIDVRLDEIVLRALEAKPELRFATATEFRTQVLALGNPAAPTATPVAPVPKEHLKWVPLAMGCVWWFLGVIGATAVFTVISDQSNFLPVLAGMIVMAPFVGGLVQKRWRASLEKSATSGDATGLWFFSWTAILLSLLAWGMTALFVFCLATERGGWNPATNEALFVVLSLLGAVLLPASALVLFRAAKSLESPSRPRRSVLSLLLRFGLLGAVATAAVIGVLAFLYAKSSQARAEIEMVRARSAQNSASQEIRRLSREIWKNAGDVPGRIEGVTPIDQGFSQDISKNARNVPPAPPNPGAAITLTLFTNQNGYAMVNSHVQLAPGETIHAWLIHPDGRRQPATSVLSVFGHGDQESGICNWSWPAALPFKTNRTDEIVTQLRERWDGQLLVCPPGQPVNVFTITNAAGLRLAGELQFNRTFPAPTSPVVAEIRLRQQMGLLLFFRDTPPGGYSLRLRSGGTEGDQAHSTLSHSYSASLNDATASWHWTDPDFESAKAIVAKQIADLFATGPLRITNGHPRTLFAVTNAAGKSYVGQMELRGRGEGN